jgi:hypothetical protein|nr:MAG TPA: crossover junction endodeoxyribonuclease [Caudoviricetes sp.]
MDGDLCCVSCPANQDKDAYPPLVLELPFPPSVNHYWRSVRIGKAIGHSEKPRTDHLREAAYADAENW